MGYEYKYGIVMGGKCSTPGHENCTCNDWELINGKNYRATDIVKAIKKGAKTLKEAAKIIETDEINKDYVPYEQALSLKELGFDKPCYANMFDHSKPDIEHGHNRIRYYSPEHADNFNKEFDFGAENCKDLFVSIPLYSQALNWFEDEYSIFVERRVATSVNEIMDIEYYLKSWRFPPIEIVFENPIDAFDRDKANITCIKKLIETVKEK